MFVDTNAPRRGHQSCYADQWAPEEHAFFHARNVILFRSGFANALHRGGRARRVDSALTRGAGRHLSPAVAGAAHSLRAAEQWRDLDIPSGAAEHAGEVT